MKHQIVLSLGSNWGNRHENIMSVIRAFEDIFDDFICSNLYETPAVNGIDNEYVNCVVIATTDHNVDYLNTILKHLEFTFGRNAERRQRREVPLDIDIVIFDNEILRHSDYSQDYFSKGYKQLQEKLNN